MNEDRQQKTEARFENSARSISIRRECMNSSSSSRRPGVVGRQLGSRFPRVPRRFQRAMNCLMFSNKSQLRQATHDQPQCVRSRLFLSSSFFLNLFCAHTRLTSLKFMLGRKGVQEKRKDMHIFYPGRYGLVHNSSFGS